MHLRLSQPLVEFDRPHGSFCPEVGHDGSQSHAERVSRAGWVTSCNIELTWQLYHAEKAAYLRSPPCNRQSSCCSSYHCISPWKKITDSVHSWPSVTWRKNHLSLAPLGAQIYRKMVKKYFKTLERLEQFEPKSVHVLLIIHKGLCRHNLTQASLGA